jgi:hypothetical protein
MGAHTSLGITGLVEGRSCGDRMSKRRNGQSGGKGWPRLTQEEGKRIPEDECMLEFGTSRERRKCALLYSPGMKGAAHLRSKARANGERLRCISKMLSSTDVA